MSMTIIYRYISREIIKYFCLVLIAIAMIYLAVDFFQRVDNFIVAEVSLVRMLSYFGLKLPLVISQIAPICILLTVLITFGLMNKNNEIVALKSGGVSVYFLLRPVFVIGVVSAICLFILSEVIVPVSITKANRIWLQEVKKEPLLASRQKNIWFKGQRSIYYISHYDPSKNVISGISLNYFDADFRLIKRVEAQRAVYENGQWSFENVMEQVLAKNIDDYNVSFYDRRVMEVDFFPEDLKRAVKKSEEMNVTELYSYIKSVESEGYDATVYQVDFYAKFAIPFGCIIVCIIATSIAAKRRIREGLSISIAYGLGMVFLYGLAHSLCMSIGYGGVLPPLMAAWTANLAFLCLGLINLIHAE
jgi:lipopolysaccharide export system permease protein